MPQLAAFQLARVFLIQKLNELFPMARLRLFMFCNPEDHKAAVTL